MRGVKKPILAYKVHTEYKFIKEYSSISDAAVDLNLDPADVARVTRGDRSRVKDFVFKPI